MPEERPSQPPETPAPVAEPDADRQTVRRRFAALDVTRLREAAISAMIVVILTIGVLGDLPESAITRAVWPILRPVTLLSGLDQNWWVFAPSPPQRQEYLEVDVVMASGEHKVWSFPRRNRVMGVAFTHRWRKFKESLLLNEDARPDFVHWVVRQVTGPGDRPVRAELILRTQQIPPPGVHGPGAAGAEILYSENLTGN